VGFSPFTPPVLRCDSTPKQELLCSQNVLDGSRSVHPRPAAALLELLAGAAGIHFIPTHLGSAPAGLKSAGTNFGLLCQAARNTGNVECASR